MKKTITTLMAMVMAIILASVLNPALAQSVHPEEGEAVLVIKTHLKKASYILSPRTEETPYSFIFQIDGIKIDEAVEGVLEVESDVASENGRGIHYSFEKVLRLSPGVYRVKMSTEDNLSKEVQIELEGGRAYSLSFEPSYVPFIKHNRKRSMRFMSRENNFRRGVKYYRVYLNGEKVI